MRLDDEPGQVMAGTAWTVGFTVRVHDQTPMNVDAARLLAQHRETAAEIEVVGRQEGPVGHYVAEVTFPRAGAWKWSIEPEPYEATTFETLTVVEDEGEIELEAEASLSAMAGALRLFEGSCPDDGRALVASAEVPLVPEEGANGLKRLGAETAEPIWLGMGAGEIAPASLLRGEHALAVERPGGGVVACGAVGGPFDGEGLVVGLAGVAGSGPAGVAVVGEDGAGITIRVVLTETGGEPRDAERGAAEGAAAEVEIVGSMFVPSEVTVGPGTTVTWVNREAITHTVTGDELAFEDSGVLDLDEGFSQTFDEPGVYRYRCGPHPSMVGTITVR